MTNSKPASRHRWLEMKEVHSLFGIRVLLFLATFFGRAPVHLLLRVIVLYYALLKVTARRASKKYLQQMGMPHGFWNCYRHLLCFAQCSADRLFLARGQHEFFEFESHGHHHLETLCANKRGAILLGAHLGSFEAMNAAGARHDMIVNIVGYFRNARMINQILKRQRQSVHARLLEIQPGDVGFVLQLRDCIERGELVAILGDRIIDGRSVDVDFLGHQASFPAGVYALASLLKCPVYLTFGLYHAPNRYDLYCELFAESITLPRGDYQQASREYAQRYANRLEYYCRLAPYNWFNFYDFWSSRQ